MTTVARRTAEEVVRDLVDTVFLGGRVREGFERCVGEPYVQHNPDVPDGREAGIGFFSELWERFPDFRYDVQHLLADGEFVAVHAHATVGLPGDRGRAIVDLFRVVDGLVVEHWDSVQDVPERLAHANSMFGDVHPADPEVTGAREVVLALLGSAFADATRVREGLEAHIAVDGYVQHNPEVPDGREAAITFFEGLWAQFPEFHYEPRHVLTDGDLVLVRAFANNGHDRGAAVADLFRVAGGRVVEHWDVVQMIPETAANDHPMF